MIYPIDAKGFRDVTLKFTGYDSSRRRMCAVAERVQRKATAKTPARQARAVFSINLTQYPRGSVTVVTGEQFRLNTAELRTHMLIEAWKHLRASS